MRRRQSGDEDHGWPGGRLMMQIAGRLGEKDLNCLSMGLAMRALLLCSLLSIPACVCLNGERASECSEGCGNDMVELDGICVKEQFLDCCACLSASSCLQGETESQCIDRFAENELPSLSDACLEEHCVKDCLAPRRGPYERL
jgi:hypothetical protein